MEQYIYNEQNGLWYELQGDYYIPCLELPAEKKEQHIGVWGQRHLRYIRKHRKALYTSLLTSGMITTLISSKKPGNTGKSRDRATEFTTKLLLLE